MSSHMGPGLWKSLRLVWCMVALLPGTSEISQQASHKPGETEARGVKSMIVPAGIMGRWVVWGRGERMNSHLVIMTDRSQLLNADL